MPPTPRTDRLTGSESGEVSVGGGGEGWVGVVEVSKYKNTPVSSNAVGRIFSEPLGQSASGLNF
jgi:hypothetical protein